MEKFISIQKNSASQKRLSVEPSTSMTAKIPKMAVDEVHNVKTTTSIRNIISQNQNFNLADSAPSDISESTADNPSQPRLKDYPKHCEGNSHPRSFVGAWFDKYKWAEYSQERDAMFCFACRHFSLPGYKNTDYAFINRGFRRWKRAHGKDGLIEKHMNSLCHKSSTLAWAEYQRNKSENSSVAQHLSRAYQKKVCENRHYIKTLGEIILLTLIQNIAQRGHKEDDEEINPGNVKKILKLIGKHDPIIADRINIGPKNEKYTSSSIQNEMIEVFASMVREEIIEKVKSCLYFSILVDEAKDIRKTEQLSLIIRFYDESSHNVQECFISFTSMTSLNSASITDLILSSLRRFQLDYKNSLVGLGFDGATVMSGEMSGVQKRIRDEAPFAYYVHCYGHRLNLVLINVAKCVSNAANFFSLLEQLYIFVSNSVVHEKFIAIQKEMYPGEQIRELQHLSDTRWWCRATSCENTLIRLESIIRLLKEISANDIGARSVSARGILAQIDVEFIYLLQFFSEILRKIYKVSQQLQNQEAVLGEASKLILSLRDYLCDLRNSNLLECYSGKINEICKNCGISSSANKRLIIKPQKLNKFILMETDGQKTSDQTHSQNRIYYEVLDHLIDELDRRFSEKSCEISEGVSALCPTGHNFLFEEHLIKFAAAYSVNYGDLKHEIPLLKKLLFKESKQPTSILQFLSFIYPYKAAFECLHKLLLIAVTIPVTSASCERSFSKMKLVKTFLRNSMTNEKLSNIALLSIESKIAESIDLDSFVDEFDSRHENRRIKLH